MPSTQVRQKIVRSARRVVVKVGTNVLTDSSGRLDPRVIASLCRQVSRLIESGRQMVVVSSGAVGAGVGLLRLPGRPKDLAMLQASAAVGQGMLMKIFERNFARHGRHAAQILVTRSDFEDRRRYVNIRRTLDALHRVGAVPIINENDTVAVDELRFGDNDLIAALTANLVQADLLALLSSVDGLIREGQVVDFVQAVGEEAFGLVQKSRSALGVGGMQAKLQAIYLATQAGVDAVLANGRKRSVLDRVILAGERMGTVFAGSRNRMAARRGWIAMAVRPAGQLVVDAGAARALVSGGKSLLPSGLTDVIGHFERDAVVAVADADGRELARGQVNYSSQEIARIKGRKSNEIAAILGEKPADEVIHRNNLIVTAG